MSARLSLALALLVGAVLQNSAQTPNSPDVFTELVDKDGNIRRPKQVRDAYQSLGTFTVLNPRGNEMHATYASPGTAAAYRQTGKFPDGSVLVKEVFGTEHERLTTGDAHYAVGTKVWFVMIRDEKGRYPKNTLWGNGWGWALFKSDAPDKQVANDYKKDCLGCHVPAKSTDWVYIRGYPVLTSE
ncbi:MAG TPA: cytochrome P460 family protein [Bryobacteraceae bacterium]|nr:cytochrome P460 family protein [Bryobacteraceae bacterium]